MSSFFQDLLVAMRGLRQRPGFALLAVLILGLGSGATTIMFTVMSGVVLKPLAYPDPDRLVTVHVQGDKFGDVWGFSYPDFLDCRRDCRSLDGVAAWGYSGGTISAPGEPEYVTGRRISSELFSVLGLPLVKGRSFQAEEDQVGAAPVAIISTRLWQQRYGSDPNAVGMPLNYDGKAYTVVGIAPPGFQLDGDADVFTPLGQSNESRMQWRAARFLHVAGRLRRGVTLTQAQTKLDVVSQRLAKAYPVEDGGIKQVLHPLHAELVQDVKPTLWLLFGTVGVVLLIGCVNVASLFFTRVVSRHQEFALRLALGAPRVRLLRQCLTESGALGICGGLLGLLFTLAGTHPFIRFWPDRMPRAEDIHVDWRVLLFAVSTSVLTGLIFGLVPALRANNSRIEETLRFRSRTIAGSVRRPLSAFVVCQIALALVLLSATGILGRTLLRLSSLNPGIDIRNVLTAHVGVSPKVLTDPAKARADWKDLLEDVRRVPAVKSAALTDIVPMREGENTLWYSTTATIPPLSQAPWALASAVTPDYLHVMRVPLIRGRFFDYNDKLGNTQVVVIDQKLAHHAFGAEDPVGRLLWIPALGDKPIEVVGVVGHVRNWGLAGDDLARVQDQLYYPLAQVPDRLVRLFSSVISLVVRTDVPPLNTLQALQQHVRGATGDQSLYDINTMEQLASGSLAKQRFLLLLFSIFSALSLLLACVGIYSVLTYLTNQRVPEIGVRLAIGADSSDIARLVLREAMLIILAGTSIGLASSLGTARLLHHLVPVVQTSQAFNFVVILPVMLAVALLASYLPARRAAKVDPMVALRCE
jgi:predicted permease